MSTAQKVIKYCAIGFAMLLIFSIFSGIIAGGIGIMTATKFISNATNANLICEESESPCLKIALAYSDLEIKSGADFSATSDYDRIEVKKEGDNILITEKNGELISDKSRKTTVTIPENMLLTVVDISGGAGRIQIGAIKAERFNASLGIGETIISSLDAGEVKINTGIGKLDLTLLGEQDDYEIKAEKGIGKMTINDKEIGSSTTTGSGSRKVEISGGIGEITIKTRRDE